MKRVGILEAACGPARQFDPVAAALEMGSIQPLYTVKQDGDGHVVVQEGVGKVCFCFADDGGEEAHRIAAMLSNKTMPSQSVDLGQFWEPIKQAVHTALSAHAASLSQKKRELVAVYVARQLRDSTKVVQS